MRSTRFSDSGAGAEQQEGPERQLAQPILLCAAIVTVSVVRAYVALAGVVFLVSLAIPAGTVMTNLRGQAACRSLGKYGC